MSTDSTDAIISRGYTWTGRANPGGLESALQFGEFRHPTENSPRNTTFIPRLTATPHQLGGTPHFRTETRVTCLSSWSMLSGEMGTREVLRPLTPSKAAAGTRFRSILCRPGHISTWAPGSSPRRSHNALRGGGFPEAAKPPGASLVGRGFHSARRSG